MKRLITIVLFLCLLPSLCFGNMNPYIAGQTAAESSCATCSEDFAVTDGTTNESLSSSATGNSFQATAGNLCYIDVYMAYIADASSITVRWGTTANLGTYEATETRSLGTDDDVKYQRFTFTTKGSVSGSTTYYFGIVLNSGSNVISKKNESGTYANGSLHYASSPGWNMDTDASSADINFKVGFCD